MRMLALVGLVAAVGCSPSPNSAPQGGDATASQREVMNEVGQLLRSYPPKAGKGPAKVADLAPYQQGGPIGFEALKSGNVVVLWGGTMAEEGDVASGAAGSVIAHEKVTPTDGGLVLLTTGEVKAMTAAEFAAAPKAAKK